MKREELAALLLMPRVMSVTVEPLEVCYTSARGRDWKATAAPAAPGVLEVWRKMRAGKRAGKQVWGWRRVSTLEASRLAAHIAEVGGEL